MKKIIVAILALVGAVTMQPMTAQAFLSNWYLDVDGAGGLAPVLIGEYLDTVGNTRVQLLGGSAFSEIAVFESENHDGGIDLPAVPEITAVFNGGGFFTSPTSIAFNPGGTLDIYSDVANNYASTGANTYGSTDGTKIASFALLNGGGNIDAATLVPNGELTTMFRATYLRPGYWFMPDLVTDMTFNPVSWVLGFGTTNGSAVANPNAFLTAGLGPVGNGAFFISNNGQFRIITPEPGSMLLLGMGLAGLAALRRKKVA